MTATSQHSAPVQTRRHFYFCANCKDLIITAEPRGHDVCSHCELDTVREVICHLELAAFGNPIRSFDYRAWFDDEGEEANRYGFGTTKREAVNDLISTYGDNE